MPEKLLKSLRELLAASVPACGMAAQSWGRASVMRWRMAGNSDIVAPAHIPRIGLDAQSLPDSTSDLEHLIFQ